MTGRAPAIPVRSDEQFVREDAERSRRRRNDGGLGRCDEWGCDEAATVRVGERCWFCEEHKS